MKKTQNAILLFVFALSLLNCSLQQKIRTKKNAAAIDLKNRALEASNLFTCDSDSVWISDNGKILKRNGDPILHCAKKKAFYGDLEMVDQVIEVSNLLLLDRPFIEFSLNKRSPKPRGEKLFQYILNLASNFECLDFGDYEICIGQRYLRVCENMIRTIDGQSWDDFYTKLNSGLTMEELNALEREDHLMGDDFSAWIKRDYHILKKAYQEGKVILKDFGEH